MRNLLEMREINPAEKKRNSGVENEPNDEVAKAICGGYGGLLLEGEQEGKEDDTELVCGGDGISRAVMQPWCYGT